MLFFSGGRATKLRSLASVAVILALLLSTGSMHLVTATASTAGSSGSSWLPSPQLTGSVGSFTPDYYILGQLKGGNVYQTQRPRSLPLSGGTQFAIDYYTPGDFQGAYGLTGHFADNLAGSGETIAIIDAYGDPEVQQDLNAFSSEFGLPPTNLTIIPVGPYDPSQGITTGWDAEVALDVEAAHMMAPLANINLVIASNDSNGLFYAIKDVVTNHLGNVVSMSWGEPEDGIGISGFEANGSLGYNYADYYFSLGASEGITFFSSSGDTGAFDGTTATTGGESFPATSPSVTAVGGTTLFVTPHSGTFANLNSSATYQGEVAWSISPQYIGAQVGSGGGYSVLFSKPSYQDGAVSGDERAIPDVASDANPYTGMVIVLEGGLYVEGGTSLASATWAGIGADLDQYLGQPIGALNPDLYEIYQNKLLYDSAFNQIGSGYNGAYQAGPGFNLVTGLGSPDVPYLAVALDQLSKGLTVTVRTDFDNGVSFPQYKYGDIVTVSASIMNGRGSTVSTGSFSAQLETSTGLIDVIPLTFNGSAWIGTYSIPSSAPADTWTVTVTGSSAGESGAGSADFEVGASMALIDPVPYPYSTAISPGQPFNIEAYADSASGAAITNATLMAHFIQGGKDVFDVPLPSVGKGEYKAKGTLAVGKPQGTYTLVVSGTDFGSVFEYVYFGEGLVGVMLTPTNDAISSVSPGQEVAFLASTASSNSSGMYTSNMTAGIYTLGGELVTSVQLEPAPNIVQFGIYDFFSYQQANFTIPTYAASGFYRLTFTSTTSGNSTTGTQIGTFSTGFYVSGPAVTYTIVGPSTILEGEYLNVTAEIVDSEGSPVEAGVFNLNVLPSQLAYASAYYGSLFLSGVPMQFNQSLGVWTGSYQIPSVLSKPFYYSNDQAILSGSWTFFVSGESSSAEGATTINSYTNVLPITLLGYDRLNASSVKGASLVTYNGTSYTLDEAGGDSLNVTGLTISLGQDAIGNLFVLDSNVEVIRSQVGSLTAVNSTVALQDGTTVKSLKLTKSVVTMSGSTYQEVSPSLPTISVSGLSQPVSSLANVTITVIGGQLVSGSVTAAIDGAGVPLVVTPFFGGLKATFVVNATSMVDGEHSLYIVAPQADGLSGNYSAFFSTDAQAAALSGELATQLGKQVTSLNAALQSLSSTVNQLNAKLTNTSSEVASLTDVVYALTALAVAAVVFALYSASRGKRYVPQETLPAAQ